MIRRCWPLMPDSATLYTEKEIIRFPGTQKEQTTSDVTLGLKTEPSSLRIHVKADQIPLRYLSLRWNRKLPKNARFLGDAWERTYGDTGWKTQDASRFMPWYFLMESNGATDCFGVMVRPSAFAAWTADSAGVTLWLDLRCGACGVVLNNRKLTVATVLFHHSEDNPFLVAEEFCRKMCPDPLLPPFPVYGGNNWYYAYGKTSAEDIILDCKYIASLTQGVANRPFVVLDDGWQVSYGTEPAFNGGPWTGGNDKFPDMPELATAMKTEGVHTGIWMRPLWNHDSAIPKEWHSLRDERFLDPSVPEVIELVKNDIRRISNWGFELIKHDYTTWDIFGHWGFEMPYFPAQGNWSFHNNSKTSAEIIKELYRTIHEAAGETLILGCNTVGHLGAGLMQLARTGDDTSGLLWERTRKMGVNTLAFRLAQHRTFFDVDADCLGVAGNIPWTLNRQWAELLACSGTSFFASIKPGILSEGEFREMKEIFRLASEQTSRIEPLDWMHTTCPEEWLMNGKKHHFDWYAPEGSDPDFIS